MKKHQSSRLTAIFCITFMQAQCTMSNEESLILSALSFTYEKSLVTIDTYTYGYMNLLVKEWGEGAPLSIGKFTSFADHITIYLGGNHRVDWITTYPFGHVYTDIFESKDITEHLATRGGVSIGNDVWIGSGVTIMSGVTIGDGAVIAACSVIVKNIEPYSIVGGNPAKHIRYRFDEQTRTALQKLRWWDLEIEQIKELTHDLCASPDIEKLKFWIKKYREETV